MIVLPPACGLERNNFNSFDCLKTKNTWLLSIIYPNNFNDNNNNVQWDSEYSEISLCKSHNAHLEKRVSRD